ncbi:MAG: hypothetical protein DCC67_20645 [Planctomycetota bacterium]|nr:MAG: hypothetical protein DCC67_20645 [Planctomycetota bacterium]
MSMADAYDPYREALVMETETVWPDDYASLPPEQRAVIAARLHEKPSEAAHLEYVRVHTGFCRRIVVTADDIQRVST